VPVRADAAGGFVVVTPLPCPTSPDCPAPTVENVYRDAWFVSCSVCIDLGSCIGQGHSREDAIEAWNDDVRYRNER